MLHRFWDGRLREGRLSDARHRGREGGGEGRERGEGGGRLAGAQADERAEERESGVGVDVDFTAGFQVVSHQDVGELASHGVDVAGKRKEGA